MNKTSIVSQINFAYGFLSDHGYIPHILIMNKGETIIPNFKEGEPVLLNIDFHSIGKNFVLDENGLSVEVRFAGQPYTIYAPLENILLLQSKDASVIFRIVQTKFPTAQYIPKTEPVQEKKKTFTCIRGDGDGDGIPRGKLTIVNKRENHETDQKQRI